MGKVKTERTLEILIGICLMALGYAIYTSIREQVIDQGDTAPKFSLTADSGRTLTRSNFGGRLLVLNFWASWCQPCVQEMPSLDRFQKQFAGSGVVVLGVSVDQNEQAYRNLLQRTKVSFQTARDPEARISSEYGTFKYPETYIINSDGKVVQKIIGPTDWMDPAMVSAVKSYL